MDFGNLLSKVGDAAKTAVTDAGDFVSGLRVKISSEPPMAPPATTEVTDSTKVSTQDTRVKLIAPPAYVSTKLTNFTGFPGIIFPYTTAVNQEYTASYANLNVTHSNYTQYFYKNSSPGPITLTSKFTVQNEEDACVYLSTVHLLRALTKMQFGNDSNAGSPPPVCKLMAYGTYMFDNVPVVINTFRLELPDNVDYFTTDNYKELFGVSSVPVFSSISLTLFPIYSRREMQEATVRGWLTPGDAGQRYSGYV